MILVGELALWVALLMAAWGAIVLFAGGSSGRAELVASGGRALYATFACLVLATAGLLVALVSSDFSFEYVAAVTSANLPVGYRLTALWAGQPGALLFWTLILSMYAAMAVATSQMWHRALVPYVAGTLSIILLFFLAVLCFGVSPYERVASIPAEGLGMHPQLQNPVMVVNPPSLYLGYGATTIPFAFAIGALVVRELEQGLWFVVRRWATASWFFTTIGIITGMWWAYVEPGREGSWARDAIMSFSLFPWLATTAFLSITLWQTQRGIVRKVSLMLVAATFFLALTAAFIARRGIVASVHAAAAPNVRDWFTGFLLVGVVSVGYFATTRLRGVHVAHLGAFVREEQSSRIAKRVRVGRYALSIGAILLLLAFVGSAFRKESHVSLGPGEAATLVDPYRREWTFTSQGVSDFSERNRGVEAVALRVTRAGSPVGLIHGERRQYVDSRGVPTFEPSTEAGIDYSLLQDIYIVVTSVVGDRADLRIAFNPLMVWAWIGGVAIAIGGAMFIWPAAPGLGSRA